MGGPHAILALLRDRFTLVWLGLVGITLLSWALGTHAIHGFSGKVTRIGVLALGLVKARYVALEFMEVRRAPRVLRALLEVWCAVVFLLLGGLWEAS